MSSPTTISSLTTFEVGRWLPPALSERLGYTPDAEICIKTKFLVGSGVIGGAIWGLAFWAAREYYYAPLTWIGAGVALTLNAMVIKYGRERQQGEEALPLEIKSYLTQSRPEGDSLRALVPYRNAISSAIKTHQKEIAGTKTEMRLNQTMIDELKSKLTEAEDKQTRLITQLKQHVVCMCELDQEYDELVSGGVQDVRSPADKASFKKFSEITPVDKKTTKEVSEISP